MSVIELKLIESENWGITTGFARFMYECAIFCLDSQSHDSGAKLVVKTTENNLREFTVTWNYTKTKELIASMQDDDRTTDFGAMCISILVTRILTDCCYFYTTKKGTGIDFWLFKNEPLHLDFSKADAILEISGIRTQSPTNSITSRLAKKERQIEKSAGVCNTAYISIVEFSKPESLFECRTTKAN